MFTVFNNFLIISDFHTYIKWKDIIIIIIQFIIHLQTHYYLKYFVVR